MPGGGGLEPVTPALLPWQALLGQRLRLQETSLAPFALLPTITLGLPAPARVSG